MTQHELDRAVRVIENSAFPSVMGKPAMLINKHGTHIITEDRIFAHIGEKPEKDDTDKFLLITTLIGWLGSGILIGLILAWIIYQYTE
jgi:hypothetical protein